MKNLDKIKSFQEHIYSLVSFMRDSNKRLQIFKNTQLHLNESDLNLIQLFDVMRVYLDVVYHLEKLSTKMQTRRLSLNAALTMIDTVRVDLECSRSILLRGQVTENRHYFEYFVRY